MLVHSQVGKPHILKYIYGKQLDEFCMKNYSITLNFYFFLTYQNEVYENTQWFYTNDNQ